MLTVADAIAHGRTHLAVTCSQCRCLFHIPWGLLPGVMDSDRLDDIARRLVHKKCGARPVAEDVTTHSNRDIKFPGF